MVNKTLKDHWPSCKKCDGVLKISTLQEGKWICKNCNEVYNNVDVLEKNQILNYKNKSIITIMR